MGAIGGLLGVDGGAGGTGFAGPAMPDQRGMNNLDQSFNQLQQVAQGQGPNPAMAKYNENVQNLAKQQSGAISSIQGISPALAARMISQQGSAALQNAAAQGATTQAEQQLGAMGAAGNIAGMQAGAANQMQGNINNVNSALAMQTMQGQQNFIGGLFGGSGAAMGAGAGAGGGGAGAAAAANGGMAGKDFAAGGAVNGADALSFGQPTNGQPQQSGLSKFLSGMGNDIQMQGSPLEQGMTQFGKGLGYQLRGGGGTPTPENAGQGPTVANAQASGLGFGAAPAFARGGMSKDYRSGGKVNAGSPAQKAVKRGNSYANDKIPAVLSEGEVVIPRNVMQSPDPIRASADFVANVIAKRRSGK